MCACVVCVVMWPSLVCVCGCLGTLCGYGGCCDCDACTVVLVLHVYLLRECDGIAGVGDGGGVVACGFRYCVQPS